MKNKIPHKISLASLFLIPLFLLSGYFLAPVEEEKAEIPKTVEKLGEALFMDKILSKDKTISCASCHIPEYAFSDTIAGSLGIGGQVTGRNTPTATYMSKRNRYFWDGRANTLEEQALGPITHPAEMGLPITEAVERLQDSEFYSRAFLKVFSLPPDSTLLLKAIADFERSLETYDSPYDRFLEGDLNAMSDAAVRGFYLFFRENTCANAPCHPAEDFSADSLVVVVEPVEGEDMGLFARTGLDADRGRFKSPHLRNIAVTAPYMHDGSMKTLKEVVVFYNERENFPLNGRTDGLVKGGRTRPMTDDEVDDMVAFLEALTDQRYLDQL